MLLRHAPKTYNQNGMRAKLFTNSVRSFTVEANGFHRFVSAWFDLKPAQTQSVKVQLDVGSPELLVPAGSQLQTELKFH